MVKKIVSMGIDIDIYSKEPWPFTNWRGYAEDEIETSQKYKYRIVVENSLKNRYHSEKLFNSIRSGCVTFYLSDPELILPHLEGAFIPYDEGYLQERADLSQGVINKVGKFMYTDFWEVYSFRNFFATILDLAHVWSNIL
jgi:hypothetical protein